MPFQVAHLNSVVMPDEEEDSSDEDEAEGEEEAEPSDE